MKSCRSPCISQIMSEKLQRSIESNLAAVTSYQLYRVNSAWQLGTSAWAHEIGPRYAIGPCSPSSRAISTPPRRHILFLIVLIDLIGFGRVIPLLPFYAVQFDASPQEVTMLMAVFSLAPLLAAPFGG